MAAGGGFNVANSCYVCDLNANITETNLFDIFRAVGPVLSIRVCRNATTRKSLGDAYINFQNPSDAEKAVETMNFTKIEGRPCRVMKKRPDPSSYKDTESNIIIKNLATEIDNAELHKIMSAYGEIVSSKVVTDERGHSKGCGFVHFVEKAAADKAVETLNDTELSGTKVTVALAVSKEKMLDQSFTNCFVGNVNPETSDEKLKEFFSKYGAILSAAVRGTTGFVAFKEHESAKKAVEQANDTDDRLEGTVVASGEKLLVTRLQSKEERMKTTKGKGGKGAKGGKGKGGPKPGAVPALGTHQQPPQQHMPQQQWPQHPQQQMYPMQQMQQHYPYSQSQMGHQMGNQMGQVGAGLGGQTYGGYGAGPGGAQGYIGGMPQTFANLEANRGGLQAMQMGMAQQQMHPAGMQGMHPFAHMQQQQQQQQHMQQIPHQQQGMHQHSLAQAAGHRQQPALPQQPAAPSPARPSFPTPAPANNPSGVDPAVLARMSGEQQKNFLGEKLYAKVNDLEPDNAAKITGMLLDMDNAEIVNLLDSPALLKAKVEEAVQVLKDHSMN